MDWVLLNSHLLGVYQNGMSLLKRQIYVCVWGGRLLFEKIKNSLNKLGSLSWQPPEYSKSYGPCKKSLPGQFLNHFIFIWFCYLLTSVQMQKIMQFHLPSGA